MKSKQGTGMDEKSSVYYLTGLYLDWIHLGFPSIMAGTLLGHSQT